MNSKTDERRKRDKTHRRREERRRQRWESLPQRLMRKIDEGWPLDQVADAASMEVLRARPSPEDVRELEAEIARLHGRRKQLPAGESRERCKLEIRLLAWAMTEILEMQGGVGDE